MELVLSVLPVSVPILTVELYCKWYSLFLVSSDSQINTVKICFEDLEGYQPEDESAFVDHVPNPAAVRAYCEKHNYVLDELAEELIVGRWMIEVKGF